MVEIKKKEHVIMEGNLLEYPIFSMQKSRIDRTTEEYANYHLDKKEIITRIDVLSDLSTFKPLNL